MLFGIQGRYDVTSYRTCFLEEHRALTESFGHRCGLQKILVRFFKKSRPRKKRDSSTHGSSKATRRQNRRMAESN
ncbi:MAG: hypothetical protein A2808_00615 [Candidatus Moranbacteria bacterium RIFCSPHIGHO2_01_FULL_55_24]|nr:MAG: hypothetical protein A2808_00615 [Candidatus Moranbacteria bacterium RIFCSPHIGHO2_01_FULL_55_24]